MYFVSVKAKFRIPGSAPSLVVGLLYNSRLKQEPAEVMNSNTSLILVLFPMLY